MAAQAKVASTPGGGEASLEAVEEVDAVDDFLGDDGEQRIEDDDRKPEHGARARKDEEVLAIEEPHADGERDEDGQRGQQDGQESGKRGAREGTGPGGRRRDREADGRGRRMPCHEHGDEQGADAGEDADGGDDAIRIEELGPGFIAQTIMHWRGVVMGDTMPRKK